MDMQDPDTPDTQKLDEWLLQNNLGAYRQAFKDNGITFDLLVELDRDDLREIGLNLGDRKRFLIAVRSLPDARSTSSPDSQSSAPQATVSVPVSEPLVAQSQRPAEARTSTEHAATEHFATERLATEPSRTIPVAGGSDVDAGQPQSARGIASPQSGDTPGAERRQLTVMFVDLVGSTALAEQLDPEDMGQVVRDYQSLVSRLITANGGYISRYMGDGVLAYFGWPSASEDDATHAITAALAITSAMCDLTTPDGDELTCRCGIATGLVVVGELIGEGPSREHAVVGETPNLAARLQGLAAENTTVVSDATRRLVGEQFEFQSLGLQSLKGIRHPVPVFSVVKAKLVESRFQASRQQLALPLVGRQRQLEQLHFYWQQCVAGNVMRVLLQGEAGIGKSRLLHAFTEALQSEGCHRVILQCDPLRADSALYPAIQYVNRLAGISSTDGNPLRLQKLSDLCRDITAVSVGDLCAEVLPLLCELSGIDSASDTSSQYTAVQRRQLTLHALSAVLQAPASSAGGQTKPVLLVLEDAHWIDPTTIDLLSVLTQVESTRPLMLLVTARPEFEPAALTFEDLNTIQLPRLGADACRQVVSSVSAGRHLPEHVLDEIVAKTDGVPLFAEELTKTVIESDALPDNAEASHLNTATLEIPSSLHDSLMSRLDRLQSPREVAQTAACIGREFNFALLRNIVSVDDAGLRQSLRTLVAADLIFGDEQSSYSFKHALVRDTAYESLLKSKRQQIHLQIARVLQQQFTELLAVQPELAGYHLRRGGNYIEASGFWHSAARQALQRVANKEAIAHAGSGLECLALVEEAEVPAIRKYELLFARGMGYMAVHGYAAETVSNNFNEALEIAASMDDEERFSQAARGVVTAHIVSSRFDAGLVLADTMLKRARTDMQRFYALRMQGQIYLWQACFDESRQCFERAISLYDSDYKSPLSQWDDGVLCSGFLGITLTCLGETAQAEHHHQQSVQRAAELNQPFSRCQALESWITSILLRGDDFSEPLDTLSQLADEHQMVFFQACAQMYRGIQQIHSSAPVAGHQSAGSTSAGSTIAAGAGAGIEELSRGLSLYIDCQSRLGVPKWMTYAADGYRIVGQQQQALQLLDDAKAQMDELGNEYFRAECTRVRAEAVRVGDRPQQAQVLFQQAISLSQAQGALLFELMATSGLVNLAVSQGQGSSALDALSAVVKKFADQPMFNQLRAAQELLKQHHSTPITN